MCPKRYAHRRTPPTLTTIPHASGARNAFRHQPQRHKGTKKSRIDCLPSNRHTSPLTRREWHCVCSSTFIAPSVSSLCQEKPLTVSRRPDSASVKTCCVHFLNGLAKSACSVDAAF